MLRRLATDSDVVYRKTSLASTLSNIRPMTLTDSASAPTRRVSPLWRALAIFLLLVLLLAWAASASMVTQLQAQIQHLQGRLAQVPQIRHVSVLLDAQGLPAMLATHNPQEGALTLQRLNDVKEGREDSMQVWAVSADGRTRSLGIIESKYKTLQIPLREGDLQGVADLAISAENKGGVPDGSAPSLPWLFKGALVQKSI
jgi:anti-sigma-K factor RskA